MLNRTIDWPGEAWRWNRMAMARGIVKFYLAERGWGAISSDELPSGQDAFVHYSAIEGSGYRSLDEGDVVDFDYEPAIQDSFRWVATRARKR